ncbi:MAG: lysophospholipid acyltransferase family protein [Bacteroidota bacterium]
MAKNSRVPVISYADPRDPWIKRQLIFSVEWLSGKHKLLRMYAEVLDEMDETGESFWVLAVKKLRVKLSYDEAKLTSIPSNGPVLFIANHPFGVLDGLIICYLAQKCRGPFKIMINSVLCTEEHLRPYLLPIDFNETKEAIRTNINSKNEAEKILKEGGTVVIFPAGGVSTAKGLLGKVTDLDWKLFTAKLIRKTGASVIPIYFEGKNSILFQLVSQFSLTLRLGLFIFEVNNKIGKTIKFSIGNPIPTQELEPYGSRQELISYLRDHTYALAHNIQ